jgi:hypothetical protein
MTAFAFAHLLGLRRPARATAKSTHRPAIVDWPAGKAPAPSAVDRAAAAEDRELDELNGSGLIADARLRQRARCATILQHPAAALNFAMAATLAFDTEQTKGEALAFLISFGASGKVRAVTS